MSRPETWSRHSYPLQTGPTEAAPRPPAAAPTSTPVAAPAPAPAPASASAPAPPVAPAPPASGIDEKSHVDPPKSNIKLPRHLRAVRDAHGFKPVGRNLIIALDGTGDKFDSDNSNIVHFVGCLKKDDASQVTYYQSGIGTYDGGGLSNGFNAAVDMAVGSGLGVHIRDAYHFLMQNYREGDKIILFGFSRGAYTARCLAGMLHKVGLLPAHNIAQIPFAYQFYKDDSPQGWSMSHDFKRTFCIDVCVYFIGVFDSVASVGFIPRKLPLSSTPTNKPTYFRHAMALDEHRAKFKTKRYQERDQIDQHSGWRTLAETRHWKQSKTSFNANGTPAPAANGPNPTRKMSKAEAREAKRAEELRRLDVLANPVEDTNVLEVWFTGCHADVGGGAVKNEIRHKLSQVPLRWMIRQCFDCNTGIVFHTHRLAEEGLDIHTLWPMYTSLSKPVVGPPPSLMEKFENGTIAPISHRSTTLKPVDDNDKNAALIHHLYTDDEKQTPVEEWVPEQVEDYFDALAPINDQLVQARGWWSLEFWPIKVRIQAPGSDEWVKKVRFNLGRYRPVQETEPNLHWTVQQRMHDKGYKPQVRMDRNAAWRVVV